MTKQVDTQKTETGQTDAQIADESIVTNRSSQARRVNIRERSRDAIKKVIAFNKTLGSVNPEGTPSRPTDLNSLTELIKPNYRENLSKMKMHERNLYLQKAQDYANSMTRRTGWYGWMEKRENDTNILEKNFHLKRESILNSLEELVPTKSFDFPDEDEVI